MTCAAGGCDRPVHAKGLCGTHYSQRWRKDNPGKAKALWRRQYDKNPGAKLAMLKKWHAENRDEYNRRRRERYANDPEVRRIAQERSAQWRREHQAIATPHKRHSEVQPKPKPVEPAVKPLVSGETFQDRMAEYRRIYEEAQKQEMNRDARI